MEKSEIIDLLLEQFTEGVGTVVAKYPLATEEQIKKPF